MKKNKHTVDFAKIAEPNFEVLLKENKKLKRSLGTYKTNNYVLKRTNQGLEEVIKDVKNRQKFMDAVEGSFVAKKLKIKGKSRGKEATAIACLSDIHCEENVDPETVNGINEYNLKIAGKSLDTYFVKLLYLIKHEREIVPIENLVLAWLGDFISGYIHEELMEDNSLSPTQACRWLLKHLCSGIDLLLEEGDFKQITVICKIGNHGRTTQKKRVSTAYKNSYEWLLYHFIAWHYQNKGEKRIKWVIEKGYHTYLDVYKFPCRFHHGDDMRYFGGVGGITIPVNKAIADWNKLRPVYLDFFGHFHTMLDLGNWVSNGSVIGHNAFGIKVKAKPERPQQTLSIIDKEHGKTKTLPIFVRPAKFIHGFNG